MSLPGQDGFQLLEFVGKNVGSSTWYGPVTGTTYRAGNNKLDKFLQVDKADAPGLLAMKKNKKPVFSVVVTAKAEPDLKVDKVEEERVNPGTAPPPPTTLKATDRAVEVANEIGVDLAEIQGSGRDGIITVRDVRNAQ